MNIRELISEIETTQTLNDVALSYTEISSLNLNKIRKQAEVNHTFFMELSGIFALLRYFSRRKNPNKNTFKNNKKVTILITSNFRFYGKISNITTDLFLQYSEGKQSDYIVISKLGDSLLKSKRYKQQYKKVVFKTDMPDNQELIDVVNMVKDYSQIIVVYSQFQTILKQVPVIRDISQAQVMALESSKVKKFDFTFILEPELDKMIQFFDTQIKNVLLSSVFLEAEVARVASRLITMDQAQSNAKEVLKQQQRQLIYLKRDLLNKKGLEMWITIRSSNGI